MAKKNKNKRRLNRKQLRQTIAPTKDFDFVNPHDENDVIVVTAQRLSPGHLLEMNSSSLIKAYQQIPPDIPENNTDDDNNNQNLEAVEQAVLDNFDVIVGNVKYASEIASMAIIDPETGDRIYTKEDCMLYLQPDWNMEIANWALKGAKPQEGADADDVDRFPPKPEQQEGQILEEKTE